MVDSGIVAVFALTPLVLFCAAGVVEQWRSMVTVLTANRETPQAVLLLGGMGWMKLGILVGILPDTLAATRLAAVSAHAEDATNLLAAVLITGALVLMRAARAQHAGRVAVLYLALIALCTAVSFVAFVPFGWRLP